MVDVSILGISLQKDGKTPALLLYPHNTKRIFSLQISPLEAFAVSTALNEQMMRDAGAEQKAPASLPLPHAKEWLDEGDIFSRPLTHDLLLRVIGVLGSKLLALEIHPGPNNLFGAEAILFSPQGDRRVHCRPSDGIALALRSGGTIRMSNALLAQAEDLEQVMESLSDDLRTIIAAKLLHLPGAKALGPFMESVLAAAVQSGRDMIRESIVALSQQIVKSGKFGKAEEKALEKMRKGRELSALEGNGAVPSPSALESKKADETGGRSGNANMNSAARRADRVVFPEIHPRPVKDDEEQELEAVVAPGQTIVLPGPRADGKTPTIRISLVRQAPEGTVETLDEVLFPSSGVAKEVLRSISLSQEDIRSLGNAGTEEERWSMLLSMLAPETKVPM